MYWGMDGCRAGWVAVGLTGTADYSYGVFHTLEAFWSAKAHTVEVVLIDIPIGLASGAQRNVEPAARKLLPAYSSSIFSVPAREVVDFTAKHNFSDSSYSAACDRNQELCGSRFSKQTWNILPKIYEVDQFLQAEDSARKYVIETHPEIAFWALNHKTSLRYAKKQGLGFYERLQILEQYQGNALNIIQAAYGAHRRQLNDDDIVDALACGVSARLGRLRSIPNEPAKDATGLPMQIVYPDV